MRMYESDPRIVAQIWTILVDWMADAPAWTQGTSPFSTRQNVIVPLHSLQPGTPHCAGHGSPFPEFQPFRPPPGRVWPLPTKKCAPPRRPSQAWLLACASDNSAGSGLGLAPPSHSSFCGVWLDLSLSRGITSPTPFPTTSALPNRVLTLTCWATALSAASVDKIMEPHKPSCCLSPVVVCRVLFPTWSTWSAVGDRLSPAREIRVAWSAPCFFPDGLARAPPWLWEVTSPNVLLATYGATGVRQFHADQTRYPLQVHVCVCRAPCLRQPHHLAAPCRCDCRRSTCCSRCSR
jgi:hypothetical protein